MERPLAWIDQSNWLKQAKSIRNYIGSEAIYDVQSVLLSV